MTELLTAAQMRAIEKAAIDAGEVTGLELMERAGQGVESGRKHDGVELGFTGGVTNPVLGDLFDWRRHTRCDARQGRHPPQRRFHGSFHQNRRDRGRRRARP